MSPTSLRRSSKSWSAASLLLLALSVKAWSYDQTFTVSGNLPSTLVAHRMQCKAKVPRRIDATCSNSGVVYSCDYYVYDEVPLPEIFTPDRLVEWTLRSVPVLFVGSYMWATRTFTLALNDPTNPFLMRTEACTELSEEGITLNQESVWYQASQTDNGITFSYIGPQKPVFGPDWPQHSVCDVANPSYACKTFAPLAKARFNTLSLSGRLSGKILETHGWSAPIAGGGTRNYASLLFKVDPREFFAGSLPVSWFRDGERLVDANADQPPFNLHVGETFVASAAEEVPIYLGDGQYLPDETAGKAFPETNGQKVRTYWARGSKIWKVDELKAMPLDKLRHLPLPWMSRALNQDDYESWPNKDNPLQAIPEGSDWPPIPPDHAQNLNPTILAQCPDMFQYYALFRACADKAFQSGVEVDVNSFVNYLDQINHDLQNLGGARDYTAYRPDGSVDPTAEEDPQPDQHYDIDDLRRLNPRNIVNQDPFQATRFWFDMHYGRYCIPWTTLFDSGCDDNVYRPWWDDTPVSPVHIWDGWEIRQRDVTTPAKAYLDQMSGLFGVLQPQRDLLAFIPFQWGLGRFCTSSLSVDPIMGIPGLPGLPGYSEKCVDAYGVGITGGRVGFVRYGDLEIFSAIDKRSYDEVYLRQADPNKYRWRVFIGNPNNAGSPFASAREFVMEGERVPMAIERTQYDASAIANDKYYRHYAVQSYPIVFQDENGVRSPIGSIRIRKLIHTDVNSMWIGDNFDANPVVHNDAPGIEADNSDKYDKKTAEYLTDKYNLNERDEMTWKEKENAILKIVKYIAVSEGLDLMVKLAYKYRKEAWYLAQKLGLAQAIKTTAKYVVALYRVYSEYRSTMDQMREVRDAGRRLKRNYRLLRATYDNIWHYYVHELDYSELRPTNITNILPIHLLGRADMAMWSTVNDLNSMAKGTHLLTLRFESYCTKAFGGSPQIRFSRNEQQEVAQILDQNSSNVTEAQQSKLVAMRESNPALKEPDQVWKLSTLTGMFSKQVSGSGLWLENGYTRAAHNALAFAESDARTWVALKDRMQWQYNSFTSIFVQQQSGKVRTDLADMIGRAAYVSSTPVGFEDPMYYPIESELRGASGSVVTCGGAPCFAK